LVIAIFGVVAAATISAFINGASVIVIAGHGEVRTSAVNTNINGTGVIVRTFLLERGFCFIIFKRHTVVIVWFRIPVCNAACSDFSNVLVVAGALHHGGDL
jgi:hypothetical protein